MDSGYEIVVANLEQFISAGLPDAVQQGLEKACLLVQADAKKTCPVVTGQLRNSITHEIDKGEMKGYVGTNVEYAPYVQIGTGLYSSEGNGRQDVPWTYYSQRDGQFYTTDGQKPQPYLKPALDSNRDKIQKCFEGLI